MLKISCDDFYTHTSDHCQPIKDLMDYSAGERSLELGAIANLQIEGN